MIKQALVSDLSTWLILRTRSTGCPALMSASAAGPAMADAARAAMGGARDTCTGVEMFGITTEAE